MIDLYVDGELDVSQSLALEQHVKSCEICAAQLAEARNLTRAIRGGGVYGQMPAGLPTRVRAAVTREAGLRPVTTIPVVTRREPTVHWWRPAAIAFAALVILSFVLWHGLPGSIPAGRQDTLLAQEILDSHVRSLMADHLMDVPSTDQHTVKPWFDGKLDFSPPVVDLTPNGFELAGGRLDYIDGRPVATVVYRRRKHVINLFMWPEHANAPLRTTMRNGYNLLHWQAGGLEYWVVSDLNAQEMHEFVELLEAKASAASK
jgi:anti-sigma factor RsiW